MSRPFTCTFTTVFSKDSPGVVYDKLYDVLSSRSVDESASTTTVRFYLQSDLYDTYNERVALWGNVFPYLRKFGSSLGLHVTIVDLYRGCLCDDDLHQYFMEADGLYQLNIKEIKLCQKMSAGSPFITLFAQKYGHKIIRGKIPSHEFNLIFNSLEEPSLIHLLKEYYLQDFNGIPPVHCLQLKPSSSEWTSYHDSILKATRKGARIALGKDLIRVQSYISSVSEDEISCGILNYKGDQNLCYWFKRVFTDIYEQRPQADLALIKYSDVVEGKNGLEFDAETCKMLNYLRQARLATKPSGFDASNMFEFSIKWYKGFGLNVDEVPEHAQYISDLCKKMQEVLTQSLTQVAHRVGVEMKCTVYQEVIAHNQYCKELLCGMKERKQVKDRIMTYFEMETTYPFVLCGKSGCGKSTIMADVISNVRMIKNNIIIMRFIGTTFHSRCIKRLLISICEQISVIYKQNMELPSTFVGLVRHFHNLLSLPTEDRKLHLFLDGIDHLALTHEATSLLWMPQKFSNNVKLLVSVSNEKECCFFSMLQCRLQSKSCFVDISNISLDECHDFIVHFLSFLNRTVTSEQYSLLSESILNLLPSPNWLVYVAECVSQWKSFSSIDEVRSDILKICTPKGAILSYIERVEATHGTVLVSHTLMYITLSKYGLSENELLDILSYDKQVLMEIKNSQKSYFDCSEIQNKVPFALWSSLLHDLYPHLLRFSVVVGGCMTLQWKSCLLKNLALERYFNQTEKKAHFSGKLAYYFLGNVNATVSQTQSADYDDSQYGDKQCCSESTLNSQPLQLSTFCQLYNCRKLTELPHALFNAGRKETICKILSSFRWLKAYNEMGIVDELIDCISLMIPFVHVGKTLSGIEKEFYLLRNTLQLSFSALLINPNQLSAELIGRLMPQLEKSDSSKYFIQELLVESFSMQPPLLSPIHQYSKTSGECLLLEMYGHQDVVTCISAACVKVSDNQQKLMIVSSSADGSLLCWDCNGCGVLKTFTGHTDEVLSVSLTADGNFVLSGSKDNTAKFWKVSTSTCLYTLTSHTNVVSSVVVSSDGNKAISGSFDGTIKVWNTHHNSNFKGRLLFTVKLSSTQDKELQSSVSSLALANDDITLLVGCKSGHILIVNVISGQTLKSTILGNTSVDSVMINMYNNELCIVAVSNDFVHFGKFNSMTFKTPCKSKLEGIINVTLMNFDSWLESIKHLLTDNNINTVYFTDSSRLALAGTKSGSIQVWELVDTPQKIMSFSSLLGQSSCGNFIITSSKTSCTITIFNIENINIPLYEINDFQSSVTAMHMYSFPAMLITGHIDGSVKLWKQGEIAMEIVREFNNTDSGFCSRLNVYLGNEKLLMAGYSNGDVTLWDINEGKKLRHLHHHFSEIIFVSFYQQLYIISADITGRFVIKDIKTGAIMNNYFPHKGILTAVQVGRSQDNDIIIAGYVNGIIKAFTLPKITEIQTYTDHLSQISSLHFHTLSGVDYIISSSLDRSIRVWSFAADATDNSSSLLVVDFPIVSSVLNPLLSNIYYIDKNGYLGAVHFDVFGCNIILKSLLGNIDLETS